MSGKKKLSCEFLKNFCLKTAQQIESLYSQKKWKGHHIKLIDGTELQLPKTKDNLRCYPPYQDSTGSLKARAVGVFSLATGTILNLKFGAYVGKETAEICLFRSLVSSFERGDLLLMDRLFSSFSDLCKLCEMGVDFVVRERKKQRKHKVIKRFSRRDKIIVINKNGKDLKVREVWFTRKGKTLRVITSLLDRDKYSAQEIYQLYLHRWNIEVDFRSLKSTLGMGSLRSKTPEMFEKEVWGHVLAYNFVRAVMIDCSVIKRLCPREISFKETLQFIREFQSLGTLRKNELLLLVNSMKMKVGDRDWRLEPRAVRNKKTRFRLLKVSREEGRKMNWIRSGKHISQKTVA